MKIVKSRYEFITPINREAILKRIEGAARTCYKSEDRITEESASKFVKMLINRGHEAMIEHCSLSVKIICDRGVSHEIVRHRIASYAQESTRYVNYQGKPMEFILPLWFNEDIKEDLLKYEWNPSKPTPADVPMSHSEKLWFDHCQKSEMIYNRMIKEGWKPQQARSILPNSLKTELVMTMNLREWKHFFKLRTAKDAHPQMREIAILLLDEFKKNLPEIFEDIEVK